MRQGTLKTAASAVLFFLALFASVSRAATTLASVSVSPDVTIVLGGVTAHDEDVAVDDLAGTVSLVKLGDLPQAAAVSSYHLLENGDKLFSLDTAVELSGALTVEPGDVVRYDGVSYAVEFDASANGVPRGVAIDAVTTTAGGSLLLSFDTTVGLSAFLRPIIVDDEDLVAFNGVLFKSAFDGSAAGVPEALDLDGAHNLGGGKLALSFDGSGSLGGVDFDDEDVLEYDAATGAWEMAYDGSAEHAGWASADLEAIHAEAATCDEGPDADGDGLADHCECGDISGDGFVNTVDARLIQRCAVGQVLPGICDNPLCDATGEGDCNTIDARLVQRFSVGELTKDDLHCEAKQ